MIKGDLFEQRMEENRRWDLAYRERMEQADREWRERQEQLMVRQEQQALRQEQLSKRQFNVSTIITVLVLGVGIIVATLVGSMIQAGWITKFW